ncbi:serine dehydratase subunit alpha family protein [Candidatus Riflebacteria bacterium]
MNILKEVLKHDVFPALGCTEPIAVAFAAANAAENLNKTIKNIKITVDPGVFKNGFAVLVPNTGGEKGLLIAGVLGALVKNSKAKMEVLKNVTENMVVRARKLIDSGNATICIDKSKHSLFIKVIVSSEKETVKAVIKNSHTNLVCLEKNARSIFKGGSEQDDSTKKGYRSILKKMKISELVGLAQKLDDEDYRYIKMGIDMNLAISKEGEKLKKVGYYLSDLVSKGYIFKDIFSSSKIQTAFAVDARMAGLSFPVMSSGGSGNQGIVAILVPYLVGQFFEVEESIIIKSIALSHLVNSYIKCYTGDLSPLCGCAIAAGVGAAVAIVFQQSGKDMTKITFAINNLISDLGGMLCDGAKGVCSFKVASSADSAIRSAYMALNNHGISATEGFVGETPEATIQHLGRIGMHGMAKADDTMLEIMLEKST